MIDTPYSRWREFDRSEPPSHLEVHFRGGIEDGYTLHTRPDHWLPDRHDLAAESMRGQRKLTLVFDEERDAYVWQEAPVWLGVVTVPQDVARPADWPDTTDDFEDTEVGEPAIHVHVTLRGRLLAQTAASVPEEILAIEIPELRDAAISEWGARLRGDFRAMVQHILDGRGTGEMIDAEEAALDEEVPGDR